MKSFKVVLFLLSISLFFSAFASKNEIVVNDYKVHHNKTKAKSKSVGESVCKFITTCKVVDTKVFTNSKNTNKIYRFKVVGQPTDFSVVKVTKNY